jgi:putative endonuclease
LKGKNDPHSVGAWGEDQALAFLECRGMVCIDRNFRVVVGEVDLIMDDSGILVFIEVKTRRSLNFGDPEEGITPAKMNRVYQASLEYIDLNHLFDREWRIDVVAIKCTHDLKISRIEHYPNIDYQHR